MGWVIRTLVSMLSGGQRSVVAIDGEGTIKFLGSQINRPARPSPVRSVRTLHRRKPDNEAA